jgi:hypothetical protein
MESGEKRRIALTQWDDARNGKKKITQRECRGEKSKRLA